MNFVSSEILHLINFFRMIFVLKKKSSYSCFRIELQANDKEIRHVDMTMKQRRRKKTVTAVLIYSVCLMA